MVLHSLLYDYTTPLILLVVVIVVVIIIIIISFLGSFFTEELAGDFSLESEVWSPLFLLAF